MKSTATNALVELLGGFFAAQNLQTTVSQLEGRIDYQAQGRNFSHRINFKLTLGKVSFYFNYGCDFSPVNIYPSRAIDLETASDSDLERLRKEVFQKMEECVKWQLSMIRDGVAINYSPCDGHASNTAHRSKPFETPALRRPSRG